MTWTTPGSAVIARRLGPLPEITLTAQGGEVFSTREELVAAMARLAGDRAYRDQLGRAGRRAFEERWCERVVVPKYLAIVRSAAERRQEGTILERLTQRRGQ